MCIFAALMAENKNYNMEDLIGREVEIKILQQALVSNQAELIAVYGRRRVGKTYLIRSIYEQNLLFEYSGVNKINVGMQLENFNATLQSVFKKNLLAPIAVPENWMQAFRLLRELIEANPSDEKRVVFFDEFPWMDNNKSFFLAAFDHFWNSWASKQKKLVVIICGSAASWMIKNIVRNKGGLHNRITHHIRLEPFTLYEAKLFLKNKYINLSDYDILQLFMVTGGIPYYLRNIQPGESTEQIIDKLCFSKDGNLRKEFKDLYPALFKKSERHIAVIRALSNKLSGLTRTEIIEICKYKTGGTLTKILEELEESNFITLYTPFDKTSKEAIYKLTDEYSLFYLKFIENSKETGTGTWQKKSKEQSWISWRGFAFENICLKHTLQIKKALGISGVYSEQSAWRYTPKNSEETGVQIDLLVDRQDNCINLFELKFYRTEWEMNKKDSMDLENKRAIFIEKTGTKKTVFISLLTSFGVKRNEYYLQTVQNQFKMDVLFD
jgi:uncharacterized protein